MKNDLVKGSQSELPEQQPAYRWWPWAHFIIGLLATATKSVRRLLKSKKKIIKVRISRSGIYFDYRRED
jgi:hypothetical protein